jgi:hypothetical protein
MNGFPERLYVSCIPAWEKDKFRYEVARYFDYITKDEELIRVPIGFKTDFATTWIFRFILPKTGKHNEAAVVHDYLCYLANKGQYSRKRADKIFKEAMSVLKVNPIRKHVMYGGVATYTFFKRGNK